MFSVARLHETLSWGYFSMLGVLSSDPKGLAYVAVLSFPCTAFANGIKDDGEVAHVQLILPHQ